ncbi:MAG TPA: ABC transporter ATP-binding protein [Burkholderiales bacterium]|nr:ABC transporter ATP-binding protein [Burkholderiales bacterium]
MKIVLAAVSKRYGATPAVRSLDLEIASGELFTLIGPSGCGKTTTLRMVAGLIQPSEGRIRFGERLVADPGAGVAVPAERRNLGMVFQSYALWPHLSVRRNCSLGLEARRLTVKEVRARVDQALAMVGLAGMAERYPHQLSGGQQQRVALARAIALQPEVLLFDEPLSNLDAALHEQMCAEIRSVQRRLGITTIYVTHNQAEAMMVSDRIGVMRDGSLLQVGTPEEIYSRPCDEFVAGFFGKANLLRGEATGGELRIGSRTLTLAHAPAAGPLTLLIRPEAVLFAQEGDNLVQGDVQHVSFLGGHVEYEVRVETLGTTLRVQTPSTAPHMLGRVSLRLPPDRLIALGSG